MTHKEVDEVTELVSEAFVDLEKLNEMRANAGHSFNNDTI